MSVPLLCSAGAFLLAAAALASSPGAAPGSRGERIYQQCYSCHSLEPDENLPSGPTLHRVVGKPVAAERGFNYSPALRDFARQHPRWEPEVLDRYIADPESLIPGTHMSYHGMPDRDERASLIEFLKRH